MTQSSERAQRENFCFQLCFFKICCNFQHRFVTKLVKHPVRKHTDSAQKRFLSICIAVCRHAGDIFRMEVGKLCDSQCYAGRRSEYCIVENC